MIYLRYRSHNEARYGWLDGARIGALIGDAFGEFKRDVIVAELRDVTLLPPVQPSKIVAVGENYVSRFQEQNWPRPDIPPIFLKPPSAVIGHLGQIVLPPQSSQVEHEAELAAIIGRRARWVSVEDALKFVWGYTCAIDVTARDLEAQDGHPTRCKGFDTFCPLGPWLSTDVDPADAVITCTVNGQVRQMASTRDMIFSVPQLLAFVSSVMTLEPGDVILTGTPAGVGALRPGDRIEVEIEGIGKLVNTATQ